MSSQAAVGPSSSSASASSGPSSQESFFKPLEQASANVKRCMQEDSQWADLADHLSESTIFGQGSLDQEHC